MTSLTDTSPSSRLKIYFDDRLTAIHSRPLYQKIIETLLEQGLETDRFEEYFGKKDIMFYKVLEIEGIL